MPRATNYSNTISPAIQCASVCLSACVCSDRILF